MDYFVHSNAKFHTHVLSHNSKRIIKFLLSISLLCVLFSLLPLFLQSFKPFLMVDKSYMFLLCNGLLVFIAMNSGLVNASSQTTHQSIQVAADDERSNRLEVNVLESEVAAPIAVENDMETETPQEEEEKCLMIVEQESVLSDTQEDEDLDEHGHAAEETEELNKKCEDFIRKMKAAFCYERKASYSFNFDNQKSLVVVN